MNQNIECLGCKLANNEELVYQIYENDYVTCFLDHAPFHIGHTLIVPKKHFLELDELDTDTQNAIMNDFKSYQIIVQTRWDYNLSKWWNL